MTLGPVDTAFLAANCLALGLACASGRRDLPIAAGWLMVSWWLSWPAFEAAWSLDAGEAMAGLDVVGLTLGAACFLARPTVWSFTYALAFLLTMVSHPFGDKLDRDWWLWMNLMAGVQVGSVLLGSLIACGQRLRRVRWLFGPSR